MIVNLQSSVFSVSELVLKQCIFNVVLLLQESQKSNTCGKWSFTRLSRAQLFPPAVKHTGIFKNTREVFLALCECSMTYIVKLPSPYNSVAHKEQFFLISFIKCPGIFMHFQTCRLLLKFDDILDGITYVAIHCLLHSV